jgi:hypothetical protein
LDDESIEIFFKRGKSRAVLEALPVKEYVDLDAT